MKWVVGIGVLVLLLLLGGGGILFYYMFNKLKKEQQKQPQVATQQQTPVRPTQPRLQKVAIVTPTPGKARVVVPATRRDTPEPAARVEPRRTAPRRTVERRNPPPPRARRRRRRRRRTRRTRSRRRSRRPTRRRAAARYIPPRRRSKGTDVAPPPPPGGDAPPPPPPPGGDAPPLPPAMGGGKPSKRGTGLNENALGSLLGSKKGSPRRAAPPPPPPRSNLPTSLRKSQVASVIRRKGQTITNCQESYGSGTKSITASWVIKRSGRTGSIRVSGASGRFKSCVRRAIGRWRFPKFSGDPIDITGVPFTF